MEQVYTVFLIGPKGSLRINVRARSAGEAMAIARKRHPGHEVTEVTA